MDLVRLKVLKLLGYGLGILPWVTFKLLPRCKGDNLVTLPITLFRLTIVGFLLFVVTFTFEMANQYATIGWTCPLSCISI